MRLVYLLKGVPNILNILAAWCSKSPQRTSHKVDRSDALSVSFSFFTDSVPSPACIEYYQTDLLASYTQAVRHVQLSEWRQVPISKPLGTQEGETWVTPLSKFWGKVSSGILKISADKFQATTVAISCNVFHYFGRKSMSIQRSIPITVLSKDQTTNAAGELIWLENLIRTALI